MAQGVSMQSFFIVRAKTDALTAAVQRYHRRFAELLSYSTPTLHTEYVVSQSERIAFFGYSNEPSFRLHKSPTGRIAMATGYTTHGATLAHSKATSAFGDRVRTLSGRFSAMLFEPASNRVAVANSVVRPDPIFLGENGEFQVVGTQASAIVHFLNGEYRFDTEAMFSFFNAGFFGTNETAFAGVRCLPAASTWLLEDDKESIETVHPARQKAEYRAAPLDDAVTIVATDFRAAMGQLVSHRGTLNIGLSGGLDSRLLLAAATSAGVDIKCSTTCAGAWAEADVYVAKLLCDRLGLPHKTVEKDAAQIDETQQLKLDYLARSANAVKASDGAISGYELLKPAYQPFDISGNLIGLGGEVLRAGFAEGRDKLSLKQAQNTIRFKFARHAEFFADSASTRFWEQMNAWLAPFSTYGLEGREVLDSLYADYRCGRWIGGTSRGTNHYKWLPFLDNRFANSLVRLPAKDKHLCQLHRAMLVKLCPQVSDIPLANKFWPGTRAWTQLLIRRRFPGAFVEKRQVQTNTDWRKLMPSALVDHVRDYCLKSGRIDALRGTLSVDKVASLLEGEQKNIAKHSLLVHSLYAGCVLTSGDWLKAPDIGQPLELSLDTA